MYFFIFFNLQQTPMFSLAILFLDENKPAQINKSIKYHFTQLRQTQIYEGTNATKERLFWKITLSSDTLCVIVSCQCILGA